MRGKTGKKRGYREKEKEEIDEKGRRKDWKGQREKEREKIREEGRKI